MHQPSPHAACIHIIFVSGITSVFTLSLQDCVAFLKTAYMNLTSYMSTQLDPSRVCPTALHCKPTDQDQVHL